ncbi:hypothetical protein CEXT_56091, partial [Caerostris extrusa]
VGKRAARFRTQEQNASFLHFTTVQTTESRRYANQSTGHEKHLFVFHENAGIKINDSRVLCEKGTEFPMPLQ